VFFPSLIVHRDDGDAPGENDDSGQGAGPVHIICGAVLLHFLSVLLEFVTPYGTAAWLLQFICMSCLLVVTGLFSPQGPHSGHPNTRAFLAHTHALGSHRMSFFTKCLILSRYPLLPPASCCQWGFPGWQVPALAALQSGLQEPLCRTSHSWATLFLHLFSQQTLSLFIECL
jgi:hypothetical protein